MIKYISVVLLMLLLTSLQGTHSPEYYAEINKVVVLEKSMSFSSNEPNKPYLMISNGKTATLVECNPLYYDKVKVGDTLRIMLVK